ncbi:unnamed protein product [Cyprideis torosa]|uniref:Uncharacterized protein n=1 Tax=Cyprideis torosa TaxID=163714 RepID=A0A7R8W759_9CRUS|nr:unnamed protein product [Cyprideis torosa]CAG0882420.1 unnamed protein product [Cyprideis torosa]
MDGREKLGERAGLERITGRERAGKPKGTEEPLRSSRAKKVLNKCVIQCWSWSRSGGVFELPSKANPRFTMETLQCDRGITIEFLECTLIPRITDEFLDCTLIPRITDEFLECTLIPRITDEFLECTLIPRITDVSKRECTLLSRITDEFLECTLIPPKITDVS